MTNEQLARYWMVAVGVALVAAGALGFVAGNPIASDDPGALFLVNAAHNAVHLLTGLVALGIGLGSRGAGLANGTIAFGVLYAIIGLLLIVDPRLFGLFADAPANEADHVLHGAIAIVSLVAGYLARGPLPAPTR
jgi:hypothetical protein